MKKFLVILFASVMVLAFTVPVMATVNIIDEIWVTIDEPVAGGNEADACNSLTVTAVYGNGQVRTSFDTNVINSYVDDWFVKDGESWKSLDNGSIFEAGKTYKVNIRNYIPGEDYEFNSTGVKVYINGVENQGTEEGAMITADSQEFVLAAAKTDTKAAVGVATGDQSNIALFSILGILALCGAGFVYKRREN